MKNKIKIFKNFLLSKNSDFISYSISKVHSTYSDYQKNENFYPMLTFLKKFFYFFDDNNSYPQKKKKTDIVIISNIVSLKNIKDDIYFGNLDKLLKKERIKVLTILRNHTSIRSKKIKSLLKKDSILLSKRLNYLNEILILFNFLKEIFIFIFSKKYFPVKKYLNYFDLLSIISNLRLIHQLDEILDIYKPKFVLFTYEGHAWERLLVFLCNKKNIKIKSIAYQFSTIKKNQIGLFTKLKENYSPDYIATTGNIPFKIIKKKINFSKIIKLGSSKFVKIKKITKKKIDLLVALETDQKKLFEVINFCKNFAKKNSNFSIVLRPHPIITSKARLIDKIKNITIENQNIKISNNSLKTDLQNSKFLFYTESVLCITGLSYNVEPLFFKTKNVQNIFDLKFPKNNIIKNYSDLKKKLTSKRNKKLSSYFVNYRKNYFEKYEIKKLKSLFRN